MKKPRILELKQSFIEEQHILSLKNPDDDSFKDVDVFLISTLNNDYFRLGDLDDNNSKLFTTYEELEIYFKKLTKNYKDLEKQKNKLKE